MRIYILVRDDIVVAYSVDIYLDGSIEMYIEEIPNDLIDGYYKLINDEIVIDEILKEEILNSQKPPVLDEPKPNEVDVLKQQNAFLTKQVAELNLSNKVLAQQQASLLKILAEKGIL